MKYSALTSAGIFIVAATTLTTNRAIAEERIDYNTTHVYPTSAIDKQYVIDALTPTTHQRWNYNQPLGTPVTLTYGFSGETFGYVASDATIKRDFYQYEKDAIVAVFEHISSIAGVTFVESDNKDEVDFSFWITERGASASMPPADDSELQRERTIQLGEQEYLRYLDPQRGLDYGVRFDHMKVDYKHDYSLAMWAILHEVGHVLGLSHPFYQDEKGDWQKRLKDGEQHKYFTVMEYNSPYLSSEVYQPTTLKKYDVVALQNLYGKAQGTNSGDTLYSYDDSYSFHQLIVDGNGIDTISVEASARHNIIDLRAGAFSSLAPNFVGYYFDCYDGGYEGSWTDNGDGTCTDDGHEHLNRSHNSLTIDVDTVIENAVGGLGNDILMGNDSANELTGNDGDDILQGNGGEDMIDGGPGMDTAVYVENYADYQVVNTPDHVAILSLSNKDGIDTLTNVEFAQFADQKIGLGLNEKPQLQVAETLTLRSGQQGALSVVASDADNDELSYLWYTELGSKLTLSGAETANLSLVAPSVTVPESFVLTIQVSDGKEPVSREVLVSVAPNNAPEITITQDQTVNEGGMVSLNVTATDLDNDVLTYRWVVEGATVNLTGDTTDSISFTAPAVTADTNLKVEVFVSDSFNEVSAATAVTVKHLAAPSTTTPTTVVKATEKSSGGSMGWLMLLVGACLLARRRFQVS